jgi:hypothetical protein
MVDRRKGKQINFRLTGELAERFEDYCRERGITMTQFLENSIRQALGKPLTVPQDVLGISQRTPNAGVTTTAITAADVEGLKDLVRNIVRCELETVGLEAVGESVA